MWYVSVSCLYCGTFLCIFGCDCYVSPRCHLEFLFAPFGAVACFRAGIVIVFSVLFSCFFSDVFSSGIWSSFAELSDPSLKELATRLKSTVLASKANGTTGAYRRAFLRWRGFASSKVEMQVFPAKAEHVAFPSSMCWTRRSPIPRWILPFTEFRGLTICLAFLLLLSVPSFILLVELPRG